MKEEILQVLWLIKELGLNHTDVEEVTCYVPGFGGLFGNWVSSKRVVKAGWRFSS